MTKNKIKAKNSECYSQLPEWYWKSGLHDAEILSVSQLELAPDWKSKNPNYNCFEICLNSSGALFEKDIKKIQLYNYKLKSNPIDTSLLKQLWWMSDTLTKISDSRYNLNIIIEEVNGHRLFIDIDFETAEVERK